MNTFQVQPSLEEDESGFCTVPSTFMKECMDRELELPLTVKITSPTSQVQVYCSVKDVADQVAIPIWAYTLLDFPCMVRLQVILPPIGTSIHIKSFVNFEKEELEEILKRYRCVYRGQIINVPEKEYLEIVQLNNDPKIDCVAIHDTELDTNLEVMNTDEPLDVSELMTMDEYLSKKGMPPLPPTGSFILPEPEEGSDDEGGDRKEEKFIPFGGKGYSLKD